MIERMMVSTFRDTLLEQAVVHRTPNESLLSNATLILQKNEI